MASSQVRVNPIENIRRTVLVVDDEEINRLILTNLLKTDYNIVTATDGIEALKILRSGKRIAAVLLDLKMPNMKRNIIRRASENGREIFGKDVLSRCLRSCQKEVLAAQQGRNRLFPDIPAVIAELRIGNPALLLFRNKMILPEFFNSCNQMGIYFFFF